MNPNNRAPIAFTKPKRAPVKFPHNADAWIVYQWQPNPDDPEKMISCTVGVFDSERLAERNCLDESFYVFPMVMNQPIHGAPVEHPGAYYPKRPR